VIDYAKTARGDILRIVAASAPGYAKNGELVRVTAVRSNAVDVENTAGEPCEFAFNCGAARLEPTEWRDDFPGTSQEQGDTGGTK
jgi:hypothetical protein